MGLRGWGWRGKRPVLTACGAPVQSLDSCMELDSLRERVQRIHVETEGREETRPLPPDREEGEGVRDGSIAASGAWEWGSTNCLRALPTQILTGRSPAPPTSRATCRTLTLGTRTLRGATRSRRRYSESR